MLDGVLKHVFLFLCVPGFFTFPLILGHLLPMSSSPPTSFYSTSLISISFISLHLPAVSPRHPPPPLAIFFLADCSSRNECFCMKGFYGAQCDLQAAPTSHIFGKIYVLIYLIYPSLSLACFLSSGSCLEIAYYAPSFPLFLFFKFLLLFLYLFFHPFLHLVI